ncbi:MAG: efflux RND transporter permease subunit, partial [Coxiellaceae bacterium]|nr:efflux RND transporter permease subunit [Coxiellaceae bacterium]
MKKTQGFIRLFARHRVAANLLMIFLVMMGGWSLRKLNTQFFPTIDLNFIVVVYVWPGSAADDVEKSITTPLEKELRDLDNVKEMRSRSQDGASTIIIEFQMGTDMGYALDQVNEKVAQVSNLPQDVEKPIITRVILYEPVAKLLLVGGKDLNDLRQRTYFYERQLLDRGISKVSITGLPEREIAIQIPAAKLAEIRMSLDQVATILRQRSKDVPSGSIGKLDIERQLRTIGQQRS